MARKGKDRCISFKVHQAAVQVSNSSWECSSGKQGTLFKLQAVSDEKNNKIRGYKNIEKAHQPS